MEIMKQKDYFNKNNYLELKNFCDVSNYKISDISYKEGTNNFITGHVSEKEIQVAGSSSNYMHPKYKELYYEVKKKIENILECDLLTTYYFDRVYYVEQCLYPHTDRFSCEISVSLHLSTNSNSSWPLGFIGENPEEVNYVTMIPGDAVLYKGPDVVHFRNSLKSKYTKKQNFIRKILRKSDDTYYHQIFFHYVLANGKYSYHCNDSSMN